MAKKILIYGHRGARGLAPENTIPGYALAIQLGVDYIDMDVNLTKDSVVVVTHDVALNPDLTRDQNNNWIKAKNLLIKNLTWNELQKYDVGMIKPKTFYRLRFPKQRSVANTHIPSLEEVIKLAKIKTKNKIKLQIEIKTDPKHPNFTFSPKKIVKQVIKILKRHRVITRTDLQSFDWRALQLAKHLAPKIATAYLTTAASSKQMRNPNPENHSIPKMIAALGGKVWGAESKEFTKQNVEEAHKYGLRVVPWTVNRVTEMRRMIKLGVDGIITDRPDVLQSILKN